MIDQPPDWLHDLILEGLQKLYPLSLDGTPASEILPGTALAWGQALVADRVWDEKLDAERIARGFVVLARTRERWPAPIHLLQAIRPREEQSALPKPPPDPARAQQAIAEARTLLRPDHRRAASGDES